MAVPLHFFERDSRLRWLYVMRCQSDYVKVGIAADPFQRRDAIQACNPTPVELVLRRSVPDTVAIFAERHVHAALAQYRLHGEWFRVSVQIAAKAIVAAVRAAGPRADSLRAHANIHLADTARYRRDPERAAEAIRAHNEAVAALPVDLRGAG